MGALASHLSSSPAVTATGQAVAEVQFTALTDDQYSQYGARLKQLVRDEQSSLRAKARRLLEQAALVEIALGRQQGLFVTDAYPTTFSEAAVSNLARHHSPWTWLLVIGDKPLPEPRATDPYWDDIRNRDAIELRNLFTQLSADAKRIADAWRRKAP